MKANLKCSVCGEVMGHWSKDEITDDDCTLAAAMFTCDNGHEGAIILEIVEDTDAGE